MNKALVTAIAIAAVFIFAQICFVALIVKGTETAGPIISVEPSFRTVSSDESFAVDVYIDPKGNAAAGVDYILCFNNTLLNATSLANGTFFSGFNTDTYGEGINNTAGTVDYCELIWPGTGTGVTTPGTLTTITFQVIGEDGVDELYFKKVTLSDPDGYRISNVTVINGTLEIGADVFDTGKPEDHYPSIAGTHRGLIIPDQDIKVNKIYTYPCSGTAGHSESVIIRNETTGDSAEAHWEGYTGDYHNLSFESEITLKQGVIYNYTITTGSYPQIIHAPEFDATGGKIKSTEFKDANGKKYDDWIVAFKLFFES